MSVLPARWTMAALAVVAALAVACATAFASGHGRAHRADAGTSVTLVANVNDNDLLTVVSFQYGLTTSYGSTSTSITLNALSLSAKVSITLSDLTAGVTYHYRVVASNLLGASDGPDQTFSIATTGSGSVGSGGTTVSTGTTVTASGGDTSVGTTVGTGSTGTTVGVSTGSGSDGGSSTGVGVTLPIGTTGATGAAGATGASGSSTSGSAASGSGASGSGTTATGTSASGTPSIGDAAPPQLQHTAVVTGASGNVLVQPPGAKHPFAVSGTSIDVPNGTLVILRAHSGVVDLTTALDTHGHTQSVLVWGGSFRLHYVRGAHGRVILSLAGGGANACSAGHGARTATARASRAAARSTRSAHVVRSLWGSDNHGRYTTNGNDSVATVQGTVWLTEDRCDGTLTAVRRGAVLVTNKLSHRTVRVTTGHSYLAGPGPS